MSNKSSLIKDIYLELGSYFRPPRKMLNNLVLNGFVSVLFFLGSYMLGSYNPALLPIAAATILLWTLADASISNQLVFDKTQANIFLTKHGSLAYYLLVKNLSIVVLSLPLTIVYGLVLVAIIGSWHELLYGMIAALTLVWGWLGISNAVSVILPFELVDIKTYVKNKDIWIPYGVLYVLPWVLLPVYALVMGLPFVLLGWTRADASMNHRVVSVIVLLSTSIFIWLLGLFLANKYTQKPTSRLKKLL